MKKANQFFLLYMKSLANFAPNSIGTIIGYAGGILFGSTIYLNFIDSFLFFTKDFFPYKLFDGKVYASVYLLWIIAFVVSAIFLVQAIRRIIPLLMNLHKEFESSSSEFLKTYFAIGLFGGICSFAFIWGILMPILQ